MKWSNWHSSSVNKINDCFTKATTKRPSRQGGKTEKETKWNEEKIELWWEYETEPIIEDGSYSYPK